MSKLRESAIRVMSIMAHPDDFEFNAAGAFALLRRHYGDRAKFLVLTTNRGASGHHELSPEDTFFRRREEARKSAAMIGADYECLKGLDGNHLGGQVFIDQNTLGGLWNSVCAFAPDYIFCPPMVGDPLAGIHIDHYNTALAVRMIAYQLCVPHAYPVIDRSASKAIVNPLIVNVDDLYEGREGDYHVRVDIAEVYEEKVAMAACHASQIFEWLPFVNGNSGGVTPEQWRANFRQRHEDTNRRYGMPPDSGPAEYFRFTRWGRKVKDEDLAALFPTGGQAAF